MVITMIILNGKEKEFEGEVTVEDFIRQQNYKKEQVAVEINEKIITKTDYSETVVKDGDVIEILSFMGGGERALQKS